MDRLEKFVDASVRLTGFSRTELLGTGAAEEYLQTLEHIVPTEVLERLLAATHAADDTAIAAIMADAACAAIARNIVVLWYCGTWQQLPDAWRAQHGSAASDTTRVVSANAYLTGLQWQVIGAHPPGGNMQGFAAWSQPPSGDAT